MDQTPLTLPEGVNTNEDGTLWRACVDCTSNFRLPKKDPTRSYCHACAMQRGLTFAVKTEEDVDAFVGRKRCEECHESFTVTADDPGHLLCEKCRTEDEKDEPGENLVVLEVDERPVTKPLYRQLSDSDCLEYAAELAADMETGSYIPDGKDEPWPKGRFIIREILRRMGYSPSFVHNNRRPRWWPDGGTAAFRGYVEWKVRERQMLGRVSYDSVVPYIEALTFAGFSEIARRIKLDPAKIPFRDLSQFVMRGADAIKATGGADPFSGKMSERGVVAYERISMAIKNIGDENAQNRLFALLEQSLADGRAEVQRQRIPIEATSRA